MMIGNCQLLECKIYIDQLLPIGNCQRTNSQPNSYEEMLECIRELDIGRFSYKEKTGKLKWYIDWYNKRWLSQ